MFNMATIDVSVKRQYINSKYYVGDFTYVYGGSTTSSYSSGIDPSYYVILSTFATNSSVGLAFRSNASIGVVNIKIPLSIFNASIGSITTTNATQTSQINSINASLASVTGAWSYVNTSSYYDASLRNIRAIYIPDVSLSDSYFIWNEGVLEASAAGDVTKTYVDGSLSKYATNASVNTAFKTNASLGLAFSRFSNASLGLAFSRFSNASLGLAFSRFSNASLGLMNIVIPLSIINTSIGSIISTNTTQTSQINSINASLASVTGAWSYVNTSSYYDASLNAKVSKAGDTMTGNLTSSAIIRANAIIADGTETHPSIANGYVELYMYNDGGNYVGRMSAYTGSAYKDLAIGDWNNGNPNIMLKVGGNVGIGLGTPSYKLDVDGCINFTGGLYQDGELFTGGGDATKEYVDGSLSKYATNASVNTALKTNASLGLAFSRFTNASLGVVNLKIPLSKYNASIGSITSVNTTQTNQINSINASLGSVVGAWSYVNTSSYYDASLNAKVNKINDIISPSELKFGDTTNKARIYVSDDYLVIDRGDVAGGLNFYITNQIPNTFIYSGYIYLGYTSGSQILIRGNKISGDNWEIEATGNAIFKDVSVNGSLYGIDHKANKNTTITYKTELYLLNPSDNNCVIEASGTFGIYLPTSLDTGFQATIVNVGGETITVSPGGGATLYTKDNKTKLTSRWSGATVYKRSSTQWVAMGDLQT